MMSLFDSSGARKFLIGDERKRFINASRHFPPQTKTFALTLIHTGCRLNEAIELEVSNINFTEKTIRFRTLKQKNRDSYRQVPVSDDILDELNLIHHLKNRMNPKDRVWEFTDRTGQNYIRAIMKKAEIIGIHANSKGLRHTFGVRCAKKLIPLQLTKRWMGHHLLESTLPYYKFLEFDEREMVAKTWEEDWLI